jgi:hypothetical protein
MTCWTPGGAAFLPNSTLWPVTPRKVPETGHVANVGWFKTEENPHTVALVSYRHG